MKKVMPFIKQLGINFPIIQAPMAGGATTPELVAAVSNAGCLGSLAAGYMPAIEIKKAIKEIRKLTDRTFSVNLFIPEPYESTLEKIKKACDDINDCCAELNIKISSDINFESYLQSFDEQMEVIIEEKIPIFSFTFGIPSKKYIAKLKKNNVLLIGTATTRQEALLLQENEIDMIVAQGSEAGGHRGTFLLPAEDSLTNLFDLITQTKNEIKIPIIAAGGIMNRERINAAITLGASGVQMGTAFLTCSESGISQAYKRKLLSQQQNNTVLTRVFSGKLARGLRNQFIECMHAKNATILDYPIQNELTRIMRKEAQEQANTDFMSMWAGQSADLCKETSAAELINSLI